tara:strand:- start:742 stop:1032 length:291 start_codon:yes stop_codon:yes gene_type:complete
MTDKIQEQLIDKSKTDIKQVSNEMVRLLRYFIDEETERNYNGMPWSTHGDNAHYMAPMHKDWNEISDIIALAIEDRFLESIVDVKTERLLTKLELL